MDPVDAMAINSITRIKNAPALPNKSVATAGGTNPAPASSALIGNCNAVDANPNDVANENGIANQQRLCCLRTVSTK